MQQRLIGIFDSGVGGLTVARQVEHLLPQESFLYFGDTKYVPYGSRTASDVVALISAICRHLVEQKAEVLVMACNTSSALALDPVRAWCPVPIVAIIEAAARAAVRVSRNGRIGVIANMLTAHSGAYERAVKRFSDGESFSVFPVGCPKLVPLIEAGQVGGAQSHQALLEYLTPLREQSIDTLVLGCTHYPFLLPQIREILGPKVEIVDPAVYVVEELKALGFGAQNSAAIGERRYQVSGEAQAFAAVAAQLLGYTVAPVEHVELKVSLAQG